MSDVTFESLSPTQIKVLSILHTQPNKGGQLAGNSRAPLLSAARALVRKGVAQHGYLTGHYYISSSYYDLALRCWESRAPIRAENARQRAEASRASASVLRAGGSLAV